MGRHREFNKEDALTSAVDVFWQRGYTDASIQDLCKAMSINPGSLYAAFGAKQDVFRAAIRHYLDVVTREGIGRMDLADTGTAGIRAYFDYIVEGILTGKRCYGCLGTNSFMEVSETDPEIKTLMTDHFQSLENAFDRALARDGYSDTRGKASFLACVAQGMNVLARTKPGRGTFESIVSNAMSALK